MDKAVDSYIAQQGYPNVTCADIENSYRNLNASIGYTKVTGHYQTFDSKGNPSFFFLIFQGSENAEMVKIASPQMQMIDVSNQVAWNSHSGKLVITPSQDFPHVATLTFSALQVADTSINMSDTASTITTYKLDLSLTSTDNTTTTATGIQNGCFFTDVQNGTLTSASSWNAKFYVTCKPSGSETIEINNSSTGLDITVNGNAVTDASYDGIMDVLQFTDSNSNI